MQSSPSIGFHRTAGPDDQPNRSAFFDDQTGCQFVHKRTGGGQKEDIALAQLRNAAQANAEHSRSTAQQHTASARHSVRGQALPAVRFVLEANEASSCACREPWIGILKEMPALLVAFGLQPFRHEAKWPTDTDLTRPRLCSYPPCSARARGFLIRAKLSLG